MALVLSKVLRSATTFAFGKHPMAMHSVRQYTTPSQTDPVLDSSNAPQAAEEVAPRRSYSESLASRASLDWQIMRDKESKESYRNEILKKYIDPRLDNLPKPKFKRIKKVPISVQNLFEDLASSGIINGGFGRILDHAEIAKNSQLLVQELQSLSAKNDVDALDMMQLIKDVGMGNITHAHIVEGMPVLNFSGFKPESLRALAPVIRIDNNTTSREESYLAALQHAASIAFTYALFNAVSKNQFPIAQVPINCFRTTHPEPLYTQKDKNSPEIPTASAIIGIYADKSVVTYLVDVDQIVRLLPPDLLEFGMQKRFYYPTSVFGTEPSASQQFPLISKIGNSYSIRLEDWIFVGQDPDGKGSEQYNLLQEAIDYMTVRLLQKELATEIPLGTGGFAFKDPHRTVWGRFNAADGPVHRRVMNVNADTKSAGPKIRSETPMDQGDGPKAQARKPVGGALNSSDGKIRW